MRQRTCDYLTLLMEIHTLLKAYPGERGAWEDILARVIHNTGARVAALSLKDSRDLPSTIIEVHDREEVSCPSMEIVRKAFEIIREGEESLLLPDTRRDSRFPGTEDEPLSLVAVSFSGGYREGSLALSLPRSGVGELVSLRSFLWILVSLLFPQTGHQEEASGVSVLQDEPLFPEKMVNKSKGHTLADEIEQLERERIVEALRETGGTISRAADRLGLTERVLGLRLRKYRINYRTFRRKRELPDHL